MHHFKTLSLIIVLALPGFPALAASSASQTAVLAPTMTQLAAINPAVPGLPSPLSTYTIIVLTPVLNAGVPTGEVDLMDGNTILGSAVVSDSGGGVAAASISIKLPVGTRILLARYVGDGVFSPSVSLPTAPMPSIGR